MLFKKTLSNRDIQNISAILRDFRNRYPLITSDEEAIKLHKTLNDFGIKTERIENKRPK